MRIKPLDSIFRKRLEQIRADLDEFLGSKQETAIDEDQQMCLMSAMPVEHSVAEAPEDADEAPAEETIECPPKFKLEAPCAIKGTEKLRGIPTPAFLQTTDSLPMKSSLDDVLEKKAETFSTMLLRLIDEKGLKDSDVYKRANIDRRLFSKIRGDEDYVPSKKTAISFCLALQLDLEESKELLKRAGYALSEASRFDLIIIYLIENCEYSVQFANIVLDDYGEGTLSK